MFFITFKWRSNHDKKTGHSKNVGENKIGKML